MIFRNAWILWILPVFFLIFAYVRGRESASAFLFPSGEILRTLRGTLRAFIARRMPYVRAACVVLVILALARPQISRETLVKKEGLAMMIAIDCSSTMVAEGIELGFEDLADKGKIGEKRTLKRVDAAKEVAADFIKSRPDDLIGIIAFASEAYIVCPPTFDQEWLGRALGRVKVGMIKDGTAIGSGILSAVNSLKEARARSKIVVLMTDGINNFGSVPPLVAAKAARALGVKVYTIGLASKGEALVDAGDGSGRKVYKEFRVELDEKELTKIAELTGGMYFRASDMNTLRDSYRNIDKLEKTEIEEKGFEEYTDVFSYFLLAALGLLLADIVLGNTVLRRIP